MYYQFIYEWQALIGALVGAATPISLWFLKELYQDYKNRRKKLDYLEKLLVYNINSVIDARNTINSFLENKLRELIQWISESNEKTYSVETAFFPLFSMHPIDENILDFCTGSGYLDDKMIQVVRMSKDFSLGIDDLRRQFAYTLEINRDMAFKKLIPPDDQKNQYKINIEEFRKTVKQDLFEKNIKTYIRLLATVRIGVNTLRDLGVVRWRFKFSPSFRYFRNNRDLQKFRKEAFERIDKFLKEKIDTQVEEFENFYT